MESIERMAPPSQLELDGSDTYIVTMREFLEKPRIARDFQDLKADAQRLDSIGREGDLLKAGAAEAERSTAASAHGPSRSADRETTRCRS